MCPKDADRMANSVDPDLGLHCLPRPISVRKLRIVTVLNLLTFSNKGHQVLRLNCLSAARTILPFVKMSSTPSQNFKDSLKG